MRRHRQAHRSALTVGVAAIALFGASLLPAASIAQTRPPVNRAGWPGWITGLSVVSPSEIWAVGDTESQSFTYRLSGGAWQRVPSPEPSSSLLGSVSAVSPTNAWAVGGYETPAEKGHTWILHWDGTTWETVPTPHLVTSAYLASVSASSRTNVWAVGVLEVPLLGQAAPAFILRWDGMNWTRVRVPTPSGSFNDLASVDAVSRRNVWVVGETTTGHYNRPLILHWDGLRWRRFPVAQPASSDFMLSGVSSRSSTNAWAVGRDAASPLGKTLVLRFDGTRWARVPSPNPTPQKGGWLDAVDVVSRNDVWAVGGNDFNRARTLVTHWDGTTWTRVPSPNPDSGPSGDNYLSAVDALSGGNAWVAGSYGNSRTIIAHLERH